MAESEESSPVLLDGLTDSELSRLFEFCDATAMEDLGAAVGVLQSKQWDVTQATQSFFQSRTNTDTTTMQPGASTGLRQRTNAARDQNSNGSNITQQHSAVGLRTLSSESPGFALVPLVVWPFALLVRLVMFMVHGFLALLGLGRIASAGIPRPGDPFTTDTATDTTTDAARFHGYFEHTYGHTHPPFFTGTYTQALEAARTGSKYLVVILWSKEHDDTARLGHALAHTRVVEFLDASRYIVWIGDVACGEAYGVAARLGVTAYPFVGLAAVKPESRATSRSPVRILHRIDGLIGSANTVDALARELTRRLGVPVEANEQARTVARRAQEARDADRRLRDQQNAAYEASLAQDRERERLAREREIAEQARQQEEQQIQRERQLWEQRRDQWRWATLARIVREDRAELGATDRSVGRLQLRLEDGSRWVRAFAADTPIHRVFEFVDTRAVAAQWEAHGSSPHGDDLDAIPFPKDYTHEYDFNLVSQFPRVVFDHTDAALGDAMADHGLWPSATLIVEPLYEPED
ncbi:Ubx domain-containing protein [Coemansia sp. RSA 1933]|nr:Ubx domain-containing protein [Coemansia sp. RSA 1933]